MEDAMYPHLRHFLRLQQSRILIGFAATGLAVGGFLFWSSHPVPASWAWSVATAPVLLGLFVQIVMSLQKGDVGLDIVAALSMSAALVFGEPLAANVVAMMYAGGQVLEDFAQGRAKKEMTALMGRVAQTAMRFDGDVLQQVSITAIKPGDRLLIRQGDVLPVDGRVVSDVAVLDLSALTGESLPQNIMKGSEAMSGSASAGAAFELVASRPATESTYAGIVRLVEAAQSSKAPMVRMADRYAIGFLALTVTIAAITWFLTQDTIRVLSVLVVATPCPLILAVPVALISGMSRTARMGVLVKGGGVLETMSRVRTVILDKTGTVTHGQAAITQIRTREGFAEVDVLKAAASLDQASGHVVASALIKAAQSRGLILSAPVAVVETPGTGIKGTVDGQKVVVGGNSFVARESGNVRADDLLKDIDPAAMTVAVGVDGKVAGIIVLQDQIRADAKPMLDDLRHAGVKRLVLATGDRGDIAVKVGRQLGFDLVLGDLSPDAKVAAVRSEIVNGPVMMVGDGVNDAPALAAADVGVAMGAHGTASSSEAAGVVLLVDELAPLVKAMAVARRSRTIALQSVVAGLGLSLCAMAFASFGYLPPVQGALTQEVIDVAVILNALRALR
ncbi:heavy metal translocating P-type ATPase [Rhizobium sp. PL01]|uniref:heavy metal translocating P-type ATPase n=1 Tax=Rhizobium sp. PL01 TaxID=3085631 RepID=UPI00298207B2|nr:heavy metal translocating P-type ATPase [Rhizobium sp. PL01]MDW5317519.1 heavy metal translocating P-type ATPase [Rhizobium sp. PL01]